MANQVISSVENNFTKGLVSEYTGMNFPENAATDTDNCIYTVVGDVTRRGGINYEANAIPSALNNRTAFGVSDYKWNNAGGDGSTKIYVTQLGNIVYFWRTTSATLASPISTTMLASTVNLVTYNLATSFDFTLECTYSDGNGYLFIYHPNCNTIYCTLSAGVVNATAIALQVRDFSGIPDNLQINTRSSNLTSEHQYNLQNQGWLSGNAWSATSTSLAVGSTGAKLFVVAAGLAGVVAGQSVQVIAPFSFGKGNTILLGGTVTAYAGTNLTLNITTVDPSFVGRPWSDWAIVPVSGTGYISTWNTAVGNYPSNADVWWYFKNASGVFDPATTAANVSISSGNAPRGRFILNPFDQERSLVSGISGLTAIQTTSRPSNGAWFQGRVWYAGVNAQQAATGDAPFYTWSSNIYFSTVVNSVNDFGVCYQSNDPTSENLFGILPTDGGVITIPEAGAIYKLFPLQNAMLIFATNGVWYLTGSGGIGFTANDYTVVKLSSVRSISSTSFVDVLGLPMFWNEEGIYKVEPAKQGTQLLNSPLHVNPLEVNTMTVETIQSFYDDIPLASKLFVRGSYDPVSYVVQWIYRSDQETSVTDRYEFNRMMNYNIHTKAFYPYTVASIPGINTNTINTIKYIEGPPGSGLPSVFKYLTSRVVGGVYSYTFAEENDTTHYVDWFSLNGVGADYSSYFVTGYKLHGQGQKRFQIPYIYIYSDLNDTASGYFIQSLWDYATSGDSGRWSTQQQVNISATSNFGNAFRRHRLRGQGVVLQVKVSSLAGTPFDIMGWSIFETLNQGV